MALLPEKTHRALIKHRERVDQHVQRWSEVIGTRVAVLTELLKKGNGLTAQQREAAQVAIHTLRMSDIETVRRAAQLMNKVPPPDLF